MIVGQRLLVGADLGLHLRRAVEGALQAVDAGLDARRVPSQDVLPQRLDYREDVLRVGRPARRRSRRM
jgi:hypothetical protein